MRADFAMLSMTMSFNLPEERYGMCDECWALNVNGNILTLRVFFFQLVALRPNNYIFGNATWGPTLNVHGYLMNDEKWNNYCLREYHRFLIKSAQNIIKTVDDFGFFKDYFQKNSSNRERVIAVSTWQSLTGDEARYRRVFPHAYRNAYYSGPIAGLSH